MVKHKQRCTGHSLLFKPGPLVLFVVGGVDFSPISLLSSLPTFAANVRSESPSAHIIT